MIARYRRSTTVPLLICLTAIMCHACTTPDRSALLFGEGNSPTLPPPFSFVFSWPPKTFFWSWMSVVVREVLSQAARDQASLLPQFSSNPVWRFATADAASSALCISEYSELLVLRPHALIKTCVHPQIYPHMGSWSSFPHQVQNQG